MTKNKYVWAKQTVAVKRKIKAKHDPIKEWNPDRKGYFLIRVNHDKKNIEVGHVTNKHVVVEQIVGNNAMDLYNTIAREKLISRYEHAAYMGKELYKAELCLRYGKKYIQEGLLRFGKEIVTLKRNS